MDYLGAVPDLSCAKIIVVGDIFVDKYWHGPAERISPEAPVPVVKIENEEKRLGGAANVASNLSALGCDVTLVGFVGNDIEGNFVLDELKHYKIKSEIIIDKNML